MSAGARTARQRALLLAIWAAGLAWNGLAHAQPMPAPANVVQIDASGFKEVTQDWLTMRLTTTESGVDAGTVQNQLKVAIESALVVARAQAQPGLLEVRTGQFSLYPRYGSGGKINGWQGSTELVLEGRDFARISSTAGKISTLTMGGVAFSLSREARQKLESEVQTQAIERFKARAAEVAKGFGFSGYTLREIGISSADSGGDVVMRPRVMAMEAKAAMSDAPVPVEAGKSMVNVTVSGSIQLR